MAMMFRMLITALLLIPAPLLAQATVVIWPVDPKIEADERSAAIWLENKGAEPVTLQLRSFGWSQSTGNDAMLEQQAIVASPPIAQIAPGERQLIRVIRRNPPATGEAAYRLIIDELPRPRSAAETASARLDVQMRYSLPLFVYDGTQAAVRPRLDSRVMIDNGQRWLVIRNLGTGHARLTDLAVEQGGATTSVRSGLVGYVLPGATMRWPLPDTLDAKSVLRAGVNGEPTVLSPAI
jgi:fimbrial chaperone protein